MRAGVDIRPVRRLAPLFLVALFLLAGCGQRDNGIELKDNSRSAGPSPADAIVQNTATQPAPAPQARRSQTAMVHELEREILVGLRQKLARRLPGVAVFSVHCRLNMHNGHGVCTANATDRGGPCTVPIKVFPKGPQGRLTWKYDLTCRAP